MIPQHRHHAAPRPSKLQSIIPKTKLKHVLNMLDYKEDVMEIHQRYSEEELKWRMNAFKSNLVELRNVPRDKLERYFKEAEQMRADHRSSIASSSSLPSLTTSSGSLLSHSSQPLSLASMLTQTTQYAGELHATAKAWCPTCGESFGKPTDLKRHMERICEGPTRYQCNDCPFVVAQQSLMDKHRREAKAADPEHIHGASPFGVPSKTVFGCPHCEACIDTSMLDESKRINAYYLHLVHHFRKDNVIGPGSPSKRVRAFMRSQTLVRMLDQVCSLAQVVEFHCQAAGLPAQAWRTFEWDDANAQWCYDRLERGQFHEDYYRPGLVYLDVDDFVISLIARADKSRCGIPPSAQHGANRPTQLQVELPPITLDDFGPLLQYLQDDEANQQYTGAASSAAFGEGMYVTEAFNDMGLHSTPQMHFNDTSPGEVPSSTPQAKERHKHHLSYDSENHPAAAARSKQSPLPTYIASHAQDLSKPLPPLPPQDEDDIALILEGYAEMPAESTIDGDSTSWFEPGW